jgi:hypothetical protein
MFSLSKREEDKKAKQVFNLGASTLILTGLSCHFMPSKLFFFHDCTVYKISMTTCNAGKKFLGKFLYCVVQIKYVLTGAIRCQI